MYVHTPSISSGWVIFATKSGLPLTMLQVANSYFPADYQNDNALSPIPKFSYF